MTDHGTHDRYDTHDISNIWKLDLRRGNSPNPREGACLLDAVSWLEYGELGDHPSCVCPVIAAFGRGINDALSDTSRQKLKAYIPRLVGTVDRSAVQARAEYLAWQAIRLFAPLALDCIGLYASARILRKFRGNLNVAADVADAAAADAAHAAAYATAAVRAIDATTYAAVHAAAAIDAAAHAAAYAAHATHAAHAAADVVQAAHAVFHAAAAAHAADVAAVRAANAAAYAAAAVRAIDATFETKSDEAMFAALEGVLAIGKQAEPIEPIRLKQAVESFEKARV